VLGSLKPLRQNALPNGLRLGKTVWQTAHAKWYFSAKGGIARLFFGNSVIVKNITKKIKKINEDVFFTTNPSFDYILYSNKNLNFKNPSY